VTTPDRPQFDVLVTDAEVRQGLAVIRSLGRRGLRVFATGASPRSLGFSSRCAVATGVYPSPAEGTREFALAIREWTIVTGSPL